VFEVATPKIREGYDGVDADLEAAGDVAGEGFILWGGTAFVDGQFDVFVAFLTGVDQFVHHGELLVGLEIAHVGDVLLVLTVDAAHVLVPAVGIVLFLFLDVTFGEMTQVDLVGEDYVDAIDVFSELDDEVIGHIYEAIVFV
jgi:hypothetical protein